MKSSPMAMNPRFNMNMKAHTNVMVEISIHVTNKLNLSFPHFEIPFSNWEIEQGRLHFYLGQGYINSKDYTAGNF